MEACLVKANNTHLVKVGKGRGGVDNGFWGDKIRGNCMNWKKDLKKSSFLRGEFGNGRAKGGVLTSDHLTKEAMTHPGPVFPNKIADPNSVASVILGPGSEIDVMPGPLITEDGREWAERRTSQRHITVRRQNQVPISNCVNCGINKIFILTQLTYACLNDNPLLRKRVRHFQMGMDFRDGCIELVAATQTQEETGKKWFGGTTHALRQITWDAKNKNVEHIMILSGDHLYRTDHMDFVQKHIDTGADISVPCIFVDDSTASDYGLLKIDSSGRITQFAEKPKGADLKAMQVDTTVLGLSPEQAIQYPYIAATGTYVFTTDVLFNLLMLRPPPISVDFVSEIIPSAVMNHNAQLSLECGDRSKVARNSQDIVGSCLKRVPLTSVLQKCYSVRPEFMGYPKLQD